MISYQEFIQARRLKQRLLQEIKFNTNHRPVDITKAADDHPPYVNAALRRAMALAIQLANELRGYADDIAVGRLERAVQTGSLFLIEQAINWTQMDRVLNRLVQPELHESYMLGAKEGQRQLTAAKSEIRFNVMDPKAAEWAKRSTGKLITEVVDDQKKMVADLVQRANLEGRTYQETAKDIRNFIGLHSRQVTAVENYYDGLIRSGTDPFKADRLAEKYGAQLLRYRSETIARHELLTATHEGQLQTVRESIMQGRLDPNRTFRVWNVAKDERLCELCAPMDGQEVPADQPFMTEDGTALWIPQEIHIQCRCDFSLVTKHPDEGDNE